MEVLKNVEENLQVDQKKYPKCVPAAKAASMTESQRRSAVARKRSKAQGVGGKPTNVPTFAKRKKAMGGGFMETTKNGNDLMRRKIFKRHNACKK